MSAPAASGMEALAGRAGPWAPVVLRAIRRFGRDQIPTVAASVTFYALLAIFPAISAIMSLYGLFGRAETPQDAVRSLGGLLPGGAIRVVVDDMVRLSQTPHVSLGLVFAFSLIVSLYSASAGMRALLGGLTVAYEARDTRGFVRQSLVSMGLTLAAVVAGGLALWAVATAPDWLSDIGLGGEAAAGAIRWILVLALLVAALSTLYRFGPDRSRACVLVAPGNLLAALGWMAMSFGFSWYVGHFGSYDRTFGSVGAVAGFMTWIWLSVMMILFGAELNAAIGKERGAGSGAGGC